MELTELGEHNSYEVRHQWSSCADPSKIRSITKAYLFLMCIFILKGCISTSRQKESSAGLASSLDGELARNMSGDLNHGLSEPEDSLPGSQTMQRKPPANKPTMKDKQKMRIVCQICYTGDTLLNYQ